MEHRRDIDGLRALAVLGVILFHGGIPGIGGGYVGVDVFFVISGFLITSIITRELERGEFSIASFYERRARRIFPPLFVTLGVSSVLGWFLLLPTQLKTFGASLVAATLFGSNIYFFRDVGYFAPDAETKVLLHSWSLAVEEQFYLVFPLLLLLLKGQSPRLRSACFGALVVLSFAFSWWRLDESPEAVFFLAHARAWELLVGALLALGVVPAIRNAALRQLVALSGLLAVLGAMFGFDADTPFPGPAAALPVLGTAAIVHAGTNGPTWVGRILSTQPFQVVGLGSYALYLWHWPLLVFLRQYRVVELTSVDLACWFGLTAFLSLVSWYVVEQPIRHRRVFPSRRALFGSAAAAICSTCIVGTTFVATRGVRARVSAYVADLDRESIQTSQRVARTFCTEKVAQKGYTFCKVGDKHAKPSFVAWGDSHAGAMAPGVAVAARDAGSAGYVASFTACAPFLGVQAANGGQEKCLRFRQRVLAKLEDPELKHVFLIARWGLWAHGVRPEHERGVPRFLKREGDFGAGPHDNPPLFTRGLANTLEWMRKRGKRVTVVGPVPEVAWHVTSALARLSWWHRPLDLRLPFAKYEAREKLAMELLEKLRTQYGFELLPTAPTFCNQSVCEIETDGRPIYRDEDHLTEDGARLLVPVFTEALRRESL